MITEHLLQPPGGHQRRQHHCVHYHHSSPQMELLRVRLAQLQELGQTTASRRESVAEVIKSWEDDDHDHGEHDGDDKDNCDDNGVDNDNCDAADVGDSHC